MRGTTNIPVVCVIIKDEASKVLFVLREKTGWMDGFYALPGGHVEGSESFKQAACREVLEEVGLHITPADLEHTSTTHMYYPEAVRVSVAFTAIKWSGKPKNVEPERHAKIAWLNPQHLPENVISQDMARVTQTSNYLELGWD